MYTNTSPQWAAMLSGSLSVVCSASVIRGGDLLVDELDVTGGTLTKSSDGRQIQQTLRLETVDPEGRLQAGPTAPLMPLGQQIILRAGIADKGDDPTFVELLPMGIFGIDSPESDTEVPWKLYPNGAWAVSGSTLTVNGSDPLAQVAREDFVAPERPAIGATVWSESARLLQDRLPVSASWPAGVNSAIAVSRQVTYDESRLTTLLNLAQLAGGVAWADRDGVYTMLRQFRQPAAVYTLAVGNPNDPQDRGAMVTWKPDMTRDGLYNAVIVTSEDTLGNPLRGVKYETSGPLMWGGPFGQVPLREENRLAKSNSACQAYAEQRYQAVIAGRSITVHITCVPNFALDPLDTIALQIPNKTILGLITNIVYPLGQAKMEMDVSIPFTDWVVS